MRDSEKTKEQLIDEVASLRQWALEIDVVQESLQLHRSALRSASNLQSRFMLDEKPDEIFDGLLQELLELTESEYGFIGELLYADDEQPYLKTRAITDIAWSEETRRLFDRQKVEGLEFSNLETLFGAVITDGEAVVSNDPANDPRAAGLPEGHPPLNAFLGLPFFVGGRLVGMAGVANREQGYSAEIVDLLQPLASSCGHIIQALRNEAHSRRLQEEKRSLEASLLQTRNLESLGTLTGGIAHEFNNILMAILGNAELARLLLPESSPAQAPIEEIRQATEDATELTTQMLAYSGQAGHRSEPLDLSALISPMKRLLGTAVPKRVELRFDLAASLPRVDCDRDQMRQVLTDLVTNASEAMADHSSEIVVRTRTLYCGRELLEGLDVEANLEPGAYVALEVEDDGCGMDTDTLERVFEPFFTTRFMGRGLGMASVLGIVKSHRGTIRIQSEVGRGTTVQILLPVRPSGPTELSLESASERWIGRGTILLVDDEPRIRKVAERLIAELGFDLLTAADGREGVAVFRQHADEIDLVLLDMRMPGLSGEEAMVEIRSIREDAKVILSSGYPEEEELAMADGHRPSDFIQKPYRLSALRSKLRALLEG